MPATKWPVVYTLLAQTLNKLKKSQTFTVGETLYKQLTADPEFVIHTKWIQKYDGQTKPSIDPLVFFASFNDAKQKNEDRIKRINNYCRLLGLSDRFEDIDFAGCPAPPTVKLMSSRPETSQFFLWTIFESIMAHREIAINQDVFDKIRDIYGLDIVSFTIWLFWIDAYSFIPLDKNTVRYLISNNVISRQPKSFDEYDHLLRHHAEPYLETSIKAYDAAKIAIEPTMTLPSEALEQSSIQPRARSKRQAGNFRIIAIRLLDKISGNRKRVLDTDKVYYFYKAYKIVSDRDVRYDAGKDIQLYNQGDLPVSLSAIVGKNGSGKSSITELIYLAINNLAAQHGDIKTELRRGEGLHMELFYAADFLYRITFKEKDIKIHRFETLSDRYSRPVKISFDQFDFGQFFYTVAINYSHYGLNSLHVGEWISNLFHKNDSYQAPIVINPYRDKGIIDVNVEDSLTESRLLSNLLQQVLPDNEDKNDHLRKLTDDDTAVAIKLKFLPSKFAFLYEHREKSSDGTWKVIKKYEFRDTAKYFNKILAEVCRVFHVDARLIPTSWQDPTSAVDYAFLYIVKKLISIAMTYTYWSKFFLGSENQFVDEAVFIAELHADHSHVTYKLRQAINFIRKGHILPRLKKEFKEKTDLISINDLSDDIAAIIASDEEESLQTIYLIPPPFFKVTIILDKKGDLENLSSGEKQRIYAVSSLAYHLINLNSISVQNDLIFYRYVNIIFDEAELYFHPEMQRGFIKFLLSYIRRLELYNLSGLNICMITHSPFILSDIPDHNILFLGKTEPDIKTFGSNIHDLLAHSFFLDNGFMGDHVKSVVQELVKFLDPKEENKPTGWTKIKARQVIDAIGEPLIRYRLDEMFKVQYKIELTKEQQIEALQREISRLRRS